MKKTVKPSKYLMHSIMLQDILKRGDNLVVDTDTWELGVEKQSTPWVPPKMYYVSKNEMLPLSFDVLTAEYEIRNYMVQGYLWGTLTSPLLPSTGHIVINNRVNIRQYLMSIMKEILSNEHG